MEAPAPLKPPEITSPLKSEPQALIFQHMPTPPKFSRFFKVFGKLIKKIKIIENTRNIANIVLIFRICGIKVSKIQVEREEGVSGWWVMSSSVSRRQHDRQRVALFGTIPSPGGVIDRTS
jgi:hypothetical protein